MSGELPGLRHEAQPSFAEVRMCDVATLAAASPAAGGELPSGIKLTVDAQVDAAALGRVMSVLTR